MVRIGFSRTNKWLSRLIRWFTSSEVSHAFLEYFDENVQQVMVLDVAFDGYKVVPRSLFEKDNEVVTMLEPPVDLSPGLRIVAKWLGKRYDWRAFISFHRWFRNFKAHPTENPKTLICTEMVVCALKLSDYPGAQSLDTKGTSPNELLEFLKKSGSQVIEKEKV